MTDSFIPLLQRVAGEQVFARGQALFEANAVSQYETSTDQAHNQQVKAKVHGDVIHHVDIRLLERNFDGGCSCPFSDGFDMCEHGVATLLHHQHKQTRLAQLVNGQPQERILGYLESLSHERLLASFHHVIVENESLTAHWVALADIHSGRFNLKEFKKQLTKTLPMKHIWRSAQVRLYYDNARKAMQSHIIIMQHLPAQQVLSLCELLLARFDKVQEKIDDSNGYRYGILHLIIGAMVKAFGRWDATESQKVDYLLSLVNSEFLYVDFGDVGARFLGQKLESEDANAAQTALAVSYYAKVTTIIDKALKAKEFDYAHSGLLQSLFAFYERNAQWPLALGLISSGKVDFQNAYRIIEQRIAELGEVTSLSPSSAQHEMQLIENAINVLREKTRFQGYLNKLDKLDFTRLAQGNNNNKAIERGIALFKQSLDFNDAMSVLTLAHNAQRKDELANTIVDILTENAAHTNDYSALVQWHIEQQDLTHALALLEAKVVSQDVVRGLAHQLLDKSVNTTVQSTETRHYYAQKALSLYRNLVLEHVSAKQKHHYIQAIDIINEIYQYDSIASELIITEIKETFPTHVAMIKLLDELQTELL